MKYSGIQKPDPSPGLSREAIREENRRLKIFRFVSDLTLQRLCVESLTLEEAREIVAQLRKMAVNMFPGKGSVFDLVISPRMERVIFERFGSGRTDIN